MSEFKTWLEAIDANHSDAWIREMLIHEAQRTRFSGSLPEAFAWLRGAFVDLGFRNLGLSADDLNRVLLAFVSNGLAVPGTNFRLRILRPVRSVVEPADGSEQASLPDHWKQGVVVLGDDEKYTWIGKRVGQDHVGDTDLSDYHDAGDGWVPKPGGERTTFS